MNWYTVRTVPGGGPGMNGDGAYVVADDRDLAQLAADYRRDGFLTVTSYSVDVRGAKDTGPVTILSPHLLTLRPRETPTALGVS